MKRKQLPHYITVAELAHLIHEPPELLDRLCRNRIHPPWIWRERWKAPRFALETLPEWLRILDTVDLDSLPANPPPLERPVDVFRDSRRKRAEHKSDMDVILKCFPAKVQARLRAEA